MTGLYDYAESAEPLEPAVPDELYDREDEPVDDGPENCPDEDPKE